VTRAGRLADAMAEPLIGRSEELDMLSDFVDGSAAHGGAMLLSGEPGVGKTALLNAVGRLASTRGTRVLRASGAEFEGALSFAGLNEALFPLLGAIEELDPPHREALRVALGFGSGTPPGRLIVSNAALLLLRRVAAEEPLLLIVDDLHWLDQASASVLGFVARRLAGSRVGFLAASRSGAADHFDHGGLPGYELPALDAESATALVSRRFPALAPGVRQRMLAEARGNPLALLELPTALSVPQRAAQESLPDVLPLSRRLQALFVSRVLRLPASSQHLLLLAALDGTGDLAVLKSATAGTEGAVATERSAGAEESAGATAAAACDHGNDLQALTAAERDHLIHVDEHTGRLRFHHPLIRSAVIEATPSNERRRAHRTLARVLADQPERRAWHLAEASVGPDEEVAASLEEAARLMLRRADAVGAVAALTRAADLSPLGSAGGRRLAEAAYIGADAIGELRSASELLKDARRADPDFGGTLHFAAAAASVLINGDGDVDTAHHLLTDAIESGSHGYDARDKPLVDALHTLLLVCWFGGRRELWDSLFTAINRLEPAVPPLLSLVSRVFPDPVRTARPALDDLDSALDASHDETDPARVVRLGTACVYTDRLSRIREPTWRVVRAGRDGGPVRRYLGALSHLCLDDYLTGQWDEAAALAGEGLALCRGRGYDYYAWYFRYCLALLAAARGDFRGSLDLADRITRWAAPRGARGTEVYADHVRVLVALGSGDFDTAYRHAAGISPAGVLAPYVPHALWVTYDLVEAAVHTERRAEAAAHVRAMREADIAALSPRLALLSGASAASAADAVGDEGASRYFEEALSVPDGDRWPFDFARVQLAYGEHLRRAKRVEQARAQLASARRSFAWLRAAPWERRANAELRATGLSRAGAPHCGVPELTPQEREIASLAASGLTNKQIGERLFLSHRTVSAHLYRIFPKLGITSRAALRDALAGLP
jgi:DNA-binding CsgD family transcriptional regulator